jgi:predicted Zn-ribbon and HTH transcriptional regulator
MRSDHRKHFSITYMPSGLQALCARGECRQCGLQVQHRVAMANGSKGPLLKSQQVQISWVS